ncbi:HAMP domain-containing histidine kinase [Kerstersia gyiorum]|uniref:sensor histidine kinase n=2 Tax=Kerstersia gyiorum TaxID=206506 RepID=UPI002150582D|nr:HAMP domain-containing sensor histidine kinase [Kerstersia gyiorum]MCR4157377.1 HAMP domain-containing histidine kinase [Kerstersia gyiorum]
MTSPRVPDMTGHPPAPSRLTIVLAVLAPFIVLATLLLAWSAQHALGARQQQLDAEFARLARYFDAQKQFLLALDASSRRLSRLPFSHLSEAGTQISPPDSSVRVYQARQNTADLPYALICGTASTCEENGEPAGNQWYAIGNFLTDFYAAYWSGMSEAGPYLLFNDRTTGNSLGLPTSSQPQGISRTLPASQRAAVLTFVTGIDAATIPASPAAGVLWLRLPESPDLIAGLARINLPPHLWPDSKTPPRFFAAPLSRISRFLSAETTAGILSLTLQGQTLANDAAPLPEAAAPGFRLSARGAVFSLGRHGTSHAAVLVPYRELLRGHGWLGYTLAALLVLALIATWLALRWHQRRVLTPARHAAVQASEHAQLNQALLAQPQAAICIANRHHGRLLYANPLAQAWLQQGLPASLPSPLPPPLPLPDDPGLPLDAAGLLPIQQVDWCSRRLQASYMPIRHAGQEAWLCVLHDQAPLLRCQDNLRAARHQAGVALQTHRRFLAAIRNELDAPLHNLNEALAILSLVRPDALRQSVACIRQTTDELSRFLCNLQEIHRMDSGAVSLANAPLDPHRLLQDCIAEHQPQARQKGVLLFAHVDIAVPPGVKGDATRLQQIIHNFLHNAMQLTPAGHIIARLHARPADTDHATLVLQISDSGAGIPPDALQELASTFQAPADHPLPVHGSSLNLAVNARLARLMQADIRVTSEAGLGSSFVLTLTLPLAPAPTAAAAIRAAPILDGLQVFVRSPHAELSANISAWLDKFGAQARPVQGTPLPEATRSHGILLDVLMPRAHRPAEFAGTYATAGMPDAAGAAVNLSLPTADPMAIADGLQRAATPGVDGPAPRILATTTTATLTPDSQKTILSELSLIPGNYQSLFRDTMSEDTLALSQACTAGDATRVTWLLHRVHGILLALRQNGLAQLFQAHETAIRQLGLTPGTRTNLGSLVAETQALMDERLKD